ncbi:MAG: 4-diphosphocytidyl-2-C-methyl-D-erythritol kinase [Firmicutes bacterium ADurb.Bin182]|nr:MAG: 4-diphosphocytidyl-2-C-methyl-D-erythritol kinase [Firmicutes bacterium ADurb.Bin182]
MQFAALAKVNLTLDVVGKRLDGYHLLEGIYHAVNLYDTIQIEKSVEVSVESSIALPENNSVIRAVNEYKKRTGCGGAAVKVTKRIPSEAGLGGASADAAAVLRGMHRLYGILSHSELFDAALSVGADVPFCLAGGTALVGGIGEILTPLPHNRYHFLIVMDGPGISTKELFSKLVLPLRHPDNGAAVQSIRENDATALGKRMFNSLEAPAILINPKILEIKQRMLARGALGSSMTGSGSAVIGLFEDRKKAQAAAETFHDCAFVSVTESSYPTDVIYI